MRSRLAIIALGIILGGCRGAFGDAADYFTGPVSGVGLKPATSIASGATERLAAVVVPAKTENKRVVWISSDDSVATVDQNGLVTAVAVVAHGETKNATIAVTTEEGGYTANCVVTVVEKPVAVTGVSLNTTSSYLVVNDPGVEQLTATVYPADATDQTITWTSDAPAIVSVDAAGLVTAKQAGTGTITARSANGISAGCSFIVLSEPVAVTGMRLNKTASVIAIGGTETFFPILAPYNATNRNVHWSSSDPAIATVNALGTVRGIAASAVPVIITATTTDGSNIAASVPVTIGASVVRVQGVNLDRAMATITVGRQQQFSAKVAPSNATDQNLEWKSSNPSVAVVDAGGMVMALAEGVATITVTTEDGGYSRGCVVNATSLPTYTVTYSGNGGGGIAPVDTNAYLPGSMAVVLGNTFANGSYTFTGWKDAQGKLYQPGSVFEIGNADIALSAQWALAGTGHTVRYDANGGTGSLPAGPSVYAAGATVTVLDNTGLLSRDGHVFGGWHNGSSKLQPGDAFVMGSADVVLSAVWEPTWRVVYDANLPGGATLAGGSVPVDPASYRVGQTVTVKGDGGMSVSAYTFGGWSTQRNAGILYAAGAAFTIGAADVTLYARWVPVVPDYSVTYVANTPVGATAFGSVPSDAARYPAGAAVTVMGNLNNLFAYDWNLAGWNTKADGTGTSYPFGGRFTMASGNVTLYGVWNESNTWRLVGSAGISAARADYSHIAIDGSGTPYVVFTDTSKPYSPASVLKWTGSVWESVGGAVSTQQALYPDIRIHGTTVYVTFRDEGREKKAVVRTYNGTNWIDVGGGVISDKQVTYTSLAFASDGTPFAAFVEYLEPATVKPIVKKYNGTSWETVGGGYAGIDGSYLHVAVGSDNKPSIVYADSKVRVRKQNGTGWEELGAAGVSEGNGICTDIAFDSSGTPYVVYADGAKGNKATVKKWSGSGWETLGAAGFSAGAAYGTHIAIYSSGSTLIPYVVYSDQGNGGRATVMKYTGTKWMPVGNPGFSAGGSSDPHIAIDGNGHLYVVYGDNANGSRVTVMKYQ